jgi:hypothetical protein
VTRLLALLLALAAMSCMTSRVREVRCQECAPCETSTDAPLLSPEHRTTQLRARPVEPVVDWAPAGCPPSFLACFSGADGERMRLYLQSINQWARDADRRCSRGR